MKQFIHLLRALAILLPTSIALMLSTSVDAHTDGDLHNSWWHGFSHPFNGSDHILAMVAVGLWAALTHHRTIWIIPLLFVFIMGLGGLLGTIALPTVFPEYGIIASLIILGTLLACQKKLPLDFSIILVGLFALSHGYAHGNEMPLSFSFTSYASGFMLATMLLHIIGISLALFVQRCSKPGWVSFYGILTFCYGIFLLIPYHSW